MILLANHIQFKGVKIVLLHPKKGIFIKTKILLITKNLSKNSLQNLKVLYNWHVTLPECPIFVMKLTFFTMMRSGCLIS